MANYSDNFYIKILSDKTVQAIFVQDGKENVFSLPSIQKAASMYPFLAEILAPYSDPLRCAAIVHNKLREDYKLTPEYAEKIKKRKERGYYSD